jgi:glucose/arabinose dehydrogenase
VNGNACARMSVALAAAVALTSARAAITVQPYVAGLFQPLAFIQDPTNPSIQFAVQKTGLIRVVQNGVIVGTFLDMTGQVSTSSERGLLGLVFAPDYAASGRFYVNYTNLSGDTRIARFNRSAGNPLIADPGSQFPILSVAQPFDNHNGGTLKFGPDGMLYIGMGDGGDGYDPGNRAQSPNTLLGKMLRIDVSSDAFPADPNRNYSIPPSNPFPPGNPLGALSEIWAFGYRNPWKFSFDDPARGGTGAMVVGDVGQDFWEEVDYEPALAGGRNYGWRMLEGTHPTGLGGQSFGPLTAPIIEYDHTVGHSITGGYIYRGSLLGSAYRGRYFYADFINRKLWSAQIVVDPVTHEGTAANIVEHTAEVGGGAALGRVSSIDVDSNGELFIVDFDGRAQRLMGVPVIVNPATYTLFRGRYVSGDLASLTTSDDVKLNVRPGAVITNSESPVQIVEEATAPVGDTVQLRFILEASVSINNLQQRIELYNFSTAQYNLIDARAATTSDTTTIVSAGVPAAYVNPADRRIRARLSWRAVGPLVLYPWTVRVDRSVWEILP